MFNLILIKKTFIFFRILFILYEKVSRSTSQFIAITTLRAYIQKGLEDGDLLYIAQLPQFHPPSGGVSSYFFFLLSLTLCATPFLSKLMLRFC